MTDQSKICNLSIVAHIDHGKSTLSDRLIEKCNAVFQWEMESQLLGSADLERERGITTKAWATKLNHQAVDGETYGLNLIDMPDHVDFNCGVSRSLAVCEGAVLVVNAAQGIEVQTLVNTSLVLEYNPEILPVINRIGLSATDPQRVRDKIENVIDLPVQDAPEVSAKVGPNIDAVLEDTVKNVPAPKSDPKAPFHALIFDNQYNTYRGVIVYFCVMKGTIKTGMRAKMMAPGVSYEVPERGYPFPLGMEPCDELVTDEIGYFTAPIGNVKDTRVNDAVTGVEHPTVEALPNYRPARAMVYCGIYIENGSKYPDPQGALEGLQLNDTSLSFKSKPSAILGFGSRCGFLDMLYVGIIQERLEREFDLDLTVTLSSVTHRVIKADGTVVMVDNSHNYPDSAVIELAEEPYAKVFIVSPPDYVGNIMPMHQERRGGSKDVQYLSTNLVKPHYSMLLGEITYNFFDILKIRIKDYASLDYELDKYESSELVRVDMLLGGDQVNILFFIVRRERAHLRVRRLYEELRDNVPYQLFEISVQAIIGGKVIARETARAVRKDVLAKCYGGDITRKKKLLEKWKEGKKKMRSLGMVQILTEALMTMPKLDEE